MLFLLPPSTFFIFFFFNDTATTEIYTLSLHDALPIYSGAAVGGAGPHQGADQVHPATGPGLGGRARRTGRRAHGRAGQRLPDRPGRGGGGQRQVRYPPDRRGHAVRAPAPGQPWLRALAWARCGRPCSRWWPWSRDRKSTRLNSSHSQISYAVFCLKKKKKVDHRV